MVRKNSQGMQPIEATHEKTFRVCGERLLFKTNDAALILAADYALGGMEEHGDPEGDPLTLELFLQEDVPESPRAPLDETTLPTFRMHRHLFTMTLNRANNAVVDLLNGFASGVLTPGVVEQAAGLIQVFIRTMALTMLPLGRGLLPIHASCVVRQGLGVIFCSESGTGKSTLAMACVQRGYQFLADDAVFLRRDRTGLKFTGMPANLRLYPESLPLLLPLDIELELTFSNRKWKLDVDPGQQDHASRVARADPGLIFLLERQGADLASTVERLNRVDLDDLLEIAWPYHLSWPESADANIRDLLTVPAYRLTLGTDLEQTVGLIGDLLDEHYTTGV